MQNLPMDRPVATTESFWFAGNHNLTMSPTARAIVRFSMPGLPFGRRLTRTSQTTAGGGERPAQRDATAGLVYLGSPVERGRRRIAMWAGPFGTTCRALFSMMNPWRA